MLNVVGQLSYKAYSKRFVSDTTEQTFVIKTQINARKKSFEEVDVYYYSIYYFAFNLHGGKNCVWKSSAGGYTHTKFTECVT